MNNHFFDQLSIELQFLLTFVLMVLMLELGFHFGLRKQVKPVKAQTAQVRALMGAMLFVIANGSGPVSLDSHFFTNTGKEWEGEQ